MIEEKLKIIFFIIVLIYIGTIAYFYFFQNAMLFNAKAIDKKPPFDVPNMEHISLEVDEGVVLDGVYKHADKKNAPLIIYFGGNADDATRFLFYVEKLNDFNIVIFNYRGYLQSSGKPSEANLFNDALKIYDKFAHNSRVIVIGRSLGSGVAVYLASKREVLGVVLITPYDSIASLAKEKYPFLPINLILKNRFESLKYIEKVKSPIAIIEVKNDTTIPNSHTLRLVKKIKNLSKVVVLDKTTHADVLSHPKFEECLNKIIKEIYVK